MKRIILMRVIATFSVILCAAYCPAQTFGRLNRAAQNSQRGGVDQRQQSRRKPPSRVDIYSLPKTNDHAVLYEFAKRIQKFRPSSKGITTHRRQAPRALEEIANRLKGDKRDDVMSFYFEASLDGLQQGSSYSRHRLVSQMSRELSQRPKDTKIRRLAVSLARRLEEFDRKLAVDAYDRLSESLKGKDKPLSDYLAGGRNRLRLPGKKLTLAGTPIGDKRALDWERYRGKPVLVVFWATWSSMSKSALDRIVKETQKSSGNQRFEVVGVLVDRKIDDDIRTKLRELKVSWPNLHLKPRGGLVADDFGIASVPHMFLVAPDGTVVKTGVRTGDVRRLVAQMVDRDVIQTAKQSR